MWLIIGVSRSLRCGRHTSNVHQTTVMLCCLTRRLCPTLCPSLLVRLQIDLPVIKSTLIRTSTPVFRRRHYHDPIPVPCGASTCLCLVSQLIPQRHHKFFNVFIMLLGLRSFLGYCQCHWWSYNPYRITQFYLPPGSGDFPAFTPAEAGTPFSDPWGMQGWVDLGGSFIPRQFTFQRRSPISEITSSNNQLKQKSSVVT